MWSRTGNVFAFFSQISGNKPIYYAVYRFSFVCETLAAYSYIGIGYSANLLCYILHVHINIDVTTIFYFIHTHERCLVEALSI